MGYLHIVCLQYNEIIICLQPNPYILFFRMKQNLPKKLQINNGCFFFLHHKQTSNWKVSNCKQYWLYFLRVFFCNVNEIVKKEDEYNYTYVFACSSKNVTYKYVGDAYLMKTNIFPVLLYTQKNKTCLNRRSGEMFFMLSG